MPMQKKKIMKITTIFKKIQANLYPPIKFGITITKAPLTPDLAGKPTRNENSPE